MDRRGGVTPAANSSPQGNSPDNEAALQPLREVGDVEKSQYWLQCDIMEALRAARLQGIAPESLFYKRMKLAHRQGAQHQIQGEPWSMVVKRSRWKFLNFGRLKRL